MSLDVLQKRPEDSRPGWALLVAPELERVESRLQEVMGSDVPLLFDLCMRLMSAGGKRLRPALVILSAYASSGPPSQSRMTDVAAAVEMAHMASLVHDDVVDESSERRGMATANALWGNRSSVLGGDFLLSKLFCLLAADGDLRIIRAMSQTAVAMAESEELQETIEGSIASWEANYWRIIRGKTASLISTSCECGGMIGGAEAEVTDALAEFGTQLGLAFQLTDDILDIAGDPSLTGKQSATDLIHGKFTLPVLLALQHGPDSARHALLAALNRPAMSQAEAAQAAALIVESGAIEMARDRAASCIARGLDRLAALPPSRYRDALEAVGDFVIRRSA